MSKIFLIEEIFGSALQRRYNNHSFGRVRSNDWNANTSRSVMSRPLADKFRLITDRIFRISIHKTHDVSPSESKQKINRKCKEYK